MLERLPIAVEISEMSIETIALFLDPENCGVSWAQLSEQMGDRTRITTVLFIPSWKKTLSFPETACDRLKLELS